MVEVKAQVIEFISKSLCISSEEINTNTAISNDLGVDGADADDLLIEFANTFNVDISELDMSKYFGPEVGASPWSIIKIMLFGNGLAEMYIYDLINSAKLGKWAPLKSEE